MFFQARATTDEEYEAWVASIKNATEVAGLNVDRGAIRCCDRPSEYNRVALYAIG